MTNSAGASKSDIMSHVVAVLTQLASDWEYEGEIGPDTLLFTELGLQSLDAVVLGNALQEQFGHNIPYSELLADIGRRQPNDVSVGEWVDFTHRHLPQAAGTPT